MEEVYNIKDEMVRNDLLKVRMSVGESKDRSEDYSYMGRSVSGLASEITCALICI